MVKHCPKCVVLLSNVTEAITPILQPIRSNRVTLGASNDAKLPLKDIITRKNAVPLSPNRAPSIIKLIYPIIPPPILQSHRTYYNV